MKVAILTTAYFPESSGASIRTEGIAEGLKSWGHKVVIIVPGKSYAKEQGKNATVYHIPIKKSRIANLLEKYTKYNKARYKALLKYVPSIIRQENINMIHTRQPFDLFEVGKAMQQKLNIPWVTEAHKLLSITDYENKLISKRRYNVLLRKEIKLLNESNLVVTMTHAGKETLERKGVKTRIIPVENSTSIQHSRAKGFTFEKKYEHLLYAGAIREVEAVDEILRCFQVVHKRRPNTRLLILGKGNVHNLMKLAKELGIEKAVLFLGEIPFSEIGYFYKNAKIFLHSRPDITYHKDIVGLKFYDAIKCGLPLVVSDIGKLGKWVNEKKIGLTFSSGHQEKFFQAVETLLTDKKLYQKIKKNIAAVGKELSWKNTCRELSQVYSKMQKYAE
ncbi:MAG TPA: glycosyltransferase [Candidatus Nanoarchaeia archaeon]|nr:glycosyltransferase [Candidatus Nanoarchaeia archaeon]